MNDKLPSMRTRRILLASILLASGLVLLYLHQSQPNPPKKAPQSSPQTVVNLTVPIDKAQQKLVASTEETSTYQRLLIDYLQRKFSLDARLSVAATPLKDHADVSAVEFSLLKRIAYPDELAQSLPTEKEIGPADYMVVAAANCDHIAIPADLAGAMRQNIKAGNYNMTHVLLSMQFMNENGCAIPLTPAEQTAVVKKVAAIAANKQGADDLGYEAIALLLYTNHRELVKPAWINNIVRHQLADGGWTDNGAKGKWNDHATFLATWSLLEYARPNTPDEPVIRRPL